MELRDYLRILRKSWILIVVCTLLGIAVAAVYSIAVTPKYQATTKLYVSVQSNGSAAGTADLVQGASFAQQAVTSYVDVASSARVLDKVISDLDLSTSAAALSGEVSASSPLNTVLVNITVTNKSPKLAAKIANSVGKNLASVVVGSLEKPTGGGPSLVNIQTIQPAVAPTKPSSPKVPLNIVLGLLVGLAVGVAAAALRSVLDTRIHSSHDIESVTDTPIIGGISFDPDAAKRPLVVHVDPLNPRSELFRALRTNLQFVNIEGGPRSFVVTSSVPGEGKSTTAANLAIALAETGSRVTLVDADLRIPMIAQYMGIEGGAGLTDLLIGRAELHDVLQKWGRGQLYVLPAGRIPPNPSELLGSKAMARLLKALTDECDYVIIDSPPVLLVTDAPVLSKLVGGVLLTTASGTTKRQELASTITALEHVGSHLLGIIITMVPTKGADSYGYGQYGYGVVHKQEPEMTVEELLSPRGRRERP